MGGNICRCAGTAPGLQLLLQPLQGAGGVPQHCSRSEAVFCAPVGLRYPLVYKKDTLMIAAPLENAEHVLRKWVPDSKDDVIPRLLCTLLATKALQCIESQQEQGTMMRQGGQSLARRLTRACADARVAQEGSLVQVFLRYTVSAPHP